jgi:very-short-patch-repair endonuclease
MSYPEQQFEKFLKEYGYADKYLIEREVSIFPYFIDFAFSDLKIAIEIDGSQHLEEKRKESDNKKDELLQKNG